VEEKMKFETDKDTLLKSVIITDSVISPKNINTILGNCLFSIKENSLKITGTDNEIAVKNSIDVISDSSFDFTINGKKLTQILKELPKGEVIIEIDDNFGVSIKSKSKDVKGNYKLIGTGKLEYPDIPSIGEENTIEFDQNVFKDMIKKVSYAAATDTIKPAFNGIFFISEKEGYITAVASDSRRLSLAVRSIKEGINIKEGIIIPLKTINEIQKILSTGRACFSISGNQCFFRIGNTEIISRLVDGQFPNFKQVIPKDYSIKAVVNTKKLIESLRRIMVFTREPSFKVILSFSKDLLTIESKTAELGEAVEEMTIENNSSEKLVIGINSQYMMDSIKEVDSISVVFGMTGQMSPITIVPENDENTTAVIMPIQIKNTEHE
ncbi:MAG: DNA polymerase III subunit beta, partial [Bacteroidales bacterium]